MVVNVFPVMGKARRRRPGKIHQPNLRDERNWFPMLKKMVTVATGKMVELYQSSIGRGIRRLP